ncbi:hypothetical protein C3B44_01265 [Corynebacterium yudongzhengii]|uniref:MFS transporter n=1 Tax=Corynebacterium yudongzhengii TaxID=2080740 RepID=A0A2U1T4Q9_9CORY|nr:hypothetical protein C3B44_01265 [Corynebacterium yudongzhengii]PWC00996.1 MFS transporter [Corynebacterium yudongzhengii]
MTAPLPSQSATPTKARWAFALVLLFCASVVDELIATVLMLEIDSTRGLWPSLLFATTTAGSLLASPLSRYFLIEGKSLARILAGILACEAAVILPCLYLAQDPVPGLAVFVGGLLGLLGGALWVVVLLFVAEAFEKQDYDSVNKWVTTVRNAGFVAGPALGGLLYSLGSLYIYVGCIALCLLSALFTLTKVPSLPYPPSEEEGASGAARGEVLPVDCGAAEAARCGHKAAAADGGGLLRLRGQRGHRHLFAHHARATGLGLWTGRGVDERRPRYRPDSDASDHT